MSYDTAQTVAAIRKAAEVIRGQQTREQALKDEIADLLRRVQAGEDVTATLQAKVTELEEADRQEDEALGELVALLPPDEPTPPDEPAPPTGDPVPPPAE